MLVWMMRTGHSAMGEAEESTGLMNCRAEMERGAYVQHKALTSIRLARCLT
jgi:hypothetical protein